MAKTMPGPIMPSNLPKAEAGYPFVVADEVDDCHVLLLLFEPLVTLISQRSGCDFGLSN